MLLKRFVKTTLSVLIMAAALGYASFSNAVLTPYSQNFDGLGATDPSALDLVGGDQWYIFAEVWNGEVGTGTFIYDYGVFSAPNGGPGFSAIDFGEGQIGLVTDQYLNIYSDYNNVDHGNSFNINTSVFQERTLDATDVASGTWTFSGDFKAPSVDGIAEPASNAVASVFIKTLDPTNGYATTNDIRFDSTIADPVNWGNFSISLDLSDPALEGQILQFGFNTIATDYDDSGVYYDNLCFDNDGSCSAPAVSSSSSGAVSLFGLVLPGLIGLAKRMV